MKTSRPVLYEGLAWIVQSEEPVSGMPGQADALERTMRFAAVLYLAYSGWDDDTKDHVCRMFDTTTGGGRFGVMRAAILLPFIAAVAGGCQGHGLDWNDHLGRFAFNQSGTPCISVPQGTLHESDSVWVVAGPPGSQTVHRGIMGTADSCPGVSELEAVEEVFPLLSNPWPAEAEVLGLGVWGLHMSPVVRDGVAQADVDGDGVPESFGFCAGAEGVHLTVWTGPVGTGIRRWHQYHPLPYDLEPDCTEGEMSDSAH